MSPEVLQNSSFDERSDIWALGILLYELYHNKEPYMPRTKGSKSSMFNAIARTKLEYAPGCPEAARKLIQGILQVKPSDRPSLKDIMSHEYIRSSASYSSQGLEAMTPTNAGETSVENSFYGRHGFSSNMRNKLTSGSQTFEKLRMNSNFREGYSSQSNLVEAKSVLSPKSPNIIQSFNVKMQYQKDQAPLSAQIMISPKAMKAQILSSVIKTGHHPISDATSISPQYFNNFSSAVNNTNPEKIKPIVIFSKNISDHNPKQTTSSQLQINGEKDSPIRFTPVQGDTQVVRTTVTTTQQNNQVNNRDNSQHQRLRSEHRVNDMHLSSNILRNYQPPVDPSESSINPKKDASLQSSQINLSRLNIHRANLLSTLQTINKSQYSPSKIC